MGATWARTAILTSTFLLTIGCTFASYATYDEAPPPARWGVLVTSADIDGWATIDYRIDGSTDWWDVTCP